MFEDVILVDLKTGKEIMKGKSLIIEKEEVKPKKHRIEITDEEGNKYIMPTDRFEWDGNNLITDSVTFEGVKLKSVDTIKGE